MHHLTKRINFLISKTLTIWIKPYYSDQTISFQIETLFLFRFHFVNNLQQTTRSGDISAVGELHNSIFQNVLAEWCLIALGCLNFSQSTRALLGSSKMDVNVPTSILEVASVCVCRGVARTLCANLIAVKGPDSNVCFCMRN